MRDECHYAGCAISRATLFVDSGRSQDFYSILGSTDKVDLGLRRLVSLKLIRCMIRDTFIILNMYLRLSVSYWSSISPDNVVVQTGFMNLYDANLELAFISWCSVNKYSAFTEFASAYSCPGSLGWDQMLYFILDMKGYLYW